MAQPVNAPQPGYQPATAPTLRCDVCGAYPAKKVFFVSFVGLAIAHIQRSTRGTYCRSCGTALARDHTARNLAVGWWSIVGWLVTPFLLLINLPNRIRIHNLAEPQGQTAPRLPVGRPALLRVGPWLAFVILGALVFFLVSLGR